MTAAAALSPYPQTEPFRPRFHFAPARNWMSDPNGLVWFDGEYHLFYQYNPHGVRWGHMSWGHAVSRNLVDWTELGVAIAEDDRHWIFSGSAVVDWTNSAGLGDGTAPPLIALYTGAERGENGSQSQCLAHSHDRGRSWTKFPGNPVLDLGRADFRDPKVFWHEPSSRWIMVVALSQAGRIAIHGSADLRDWQHLSDAEAGAPQGSVWECPDLFELAVEGEPGTTRWVLKFDIMRSGEPGNSVAVAVVGAFDGIRFTADPDADGQPGWQRIDHGHDFYAAMSWSDIPAADGRRVAIGWMSNHHYTAEIPTNPWRGAMTVPRALSLRRFGTGLRLVQQPVAELQARRALAVEAGPVAVAAGARHLLLDGGEWPLAFELTLDIDSPGEGLTIVIGGAPGRLILQWDTHDRRLTLDRSAGVLAAVAAFAEPCTAVLPPAVPLRLHIFVDCSSIEVFAGDGATVITAQHFIAAAPWTVTIAASGEGLVLGQTRAWFL